MTASDKKSPFSSAVNEGEIEFRNRDGSSSQSMKSRSISQEVGRGTWSRNTFYGLNQLSQVMAHERIIHHQPSPVGWNFNFFVIWPKLKVQVF